MTGASKLGRHCLVAAGVVAVAAGFVGAQSSSLYIRAEGRPAPEPVMMNGVMAPNYLSAGVAGASLMAVRTPEPRQYAVQDLVTIIVRESTENDSDSKLDTKKDYSIDGEISDFPSIQLGDLLNGRLSSGALSSTPTVGIDFKNDYKGDGSASRKDTFTSRITARIIDIKPNGTMVLEAKKYIKTDKETLEMVMTGTCRKQDISIDNTILSTQLYDLRLSKEHSGDLFDAANKGILTQFFDLLFNF